jgi:hypothetical protein
VQLLDQRPVAGADFLHGDRRGQLQDGQGLLLLAEARIAPAQLALALLLGVRPVQRLRDIVGNEGRMDGVRTSARAVRSPIAERPGRARDRTRNTR